MKKTIAVVLLASLMATGIALATSFAVTEVTKTNNETTQVITKTETVPSYEKIETIDMSKEINGMTNDKADIESIMNRFNSHVANYNSGLTGIGSKTVLLDNVTCSFPKIPTIVQTEPTQIIK